MSFYFSYLCGLVSFSVDEHGSLQVVVGVCPKRALQKGAALDPCLNLGQRQMLGKKQLTATDLILSTRRLLIN